MRRATGSILLALCAVVSAVLPVADAYAEDAAIAAYSHVEERESQTCLPAHDELACQLCRALRLASAPPASGPSPLVLVVASHAPAAFATRAAPRSVAGGASPRAPPVG